ncbi:hypothetical protein GCM10027445_42570 [Amycolatopsis endophytica]|uniref:Uncharacterized protein n=1 Tax=Amycolatopsis endophytica TaxID=860233 RepID=A0A853B7D9_9PSEU|nr:hypothetical protein [Amycolatopsis endophytica]NYI90667.1 hypothetical protein [Amycolatopsis endophytica]
MGRFWRRTWPFFVPLAVISGLGALVLWVYGGFEPRPRASPDPPAHPCATDSAVAAAVVPNQLAGTARPYTGPGPHQVLVVSQHETSGGPGGPWWDEAALPPEWQPPDGSTLEAQVPLVLCEYGTRLGQGIDRCDYGPGSLSGSLLTTTDQPRTVQHSIALENAEYHYRLYEARTGTLLDEFTLGSAGPCAFTVSVADDVWPVSIVQRPDSAALESRLRPFVDASR